MLTLWQKRELVGGGFSEKWYPKRCPGQGLHIQEQFRILVFGHTTLVLPDKVRGDKFLILGGVPRKVDYVKVMIVSVWKSK